MKFEPPPPSGVAEAPSWSSVLWRVISVKIGMPIQNFDEVGHLLYEVGHSLCEVGHLLYVRD